ncbi:hypothetical protein NUW58_g964 [Xylaria curta]|uniref:Uncharacterized protein n=2 Tax=Xylaria curta TaxID=42375 RepID=A0ACC1P3S4_9PEZI|nr:hypothetical protein NUW58_g4993 [Xylaria curta]KAJ2996494.1 hypothetical protein NUW58_g964 [Xylaria curta]
MKLIQPYADSHRNPSGPGDDRPTAIQIVEDQQLVGKWRDGVALVTGCSPGSIGAEIARVIHITGTDVYITVRNIDKGYEVAQSILADGRPGMIEVIQLDLTSLDGVRNAAQNILQKSKHLHLLINNAGWYPILTYGDLTNLLNRGLGMSLAYNPRRRGDSFCGHFLLFQLLKPALLASATESETRVINVASVAHRLGAYDLDDLGFKYRSYDAAAAYAASKLACVHFANEIERRYGSQGVHAFSVDPGIAATHITKLTPEIVSMMEKSGAGPLRKTPEQGAATPTWAAVAHELEGKGGEYLEHCGETELCTVGGFLATGRGENAYNEAAEKKLWAKSLELVDVHEDA